jgi:predicted metalloendopeptidase
VQFDSCEISLPTCAGWQALLSDRLPDYANYAHMALYFGHEIMRGFNNHSMPFDKRGSLRRWADHQTISNDGKESQCLIALYSKYDVVGQ